MSELNEPPEGHSPHYNEVLVLGRIRRHGTAHIAEQLQPRHARTSPGSGLGWELLSRMADTFSVGAPLKRHASASAQKASGKTQV